jgi:hypothetical protein
VSLGPIGGRTLAIGNLVTRGGSLLLAGSAGAVPSSTSFCIPPSPIVRGKSGGSSSSSTSVASGVSSLSGTEDGVGEGGLFGVPADVSARGCLEHFGMGGETPGSPASLPLPSLGGNHSSSEP